MKRFTAWIVGLCLSAGAVSAQSLSSPDGNLKLGFSVSEKGEPLYELDYKDKAVIEPSLMGFVLNDGKPSFHDGFEIEFFDTTSFDGTWRPVWGEQAEIRNRYNEMVVVLRQNEPSRHLVVRFRLFDDGLGFRYEFTRSHNMRDVTIADELTQFNMAGDHTAYWIPGDYHTQEFNITTSRLSQIESKIDSAASTYSAGYKYTLHPDVVVQTPLMMKSAEGIYINIHEAALVDYSCMHLELGDGGRSFSTFLVPNAIGDKAYFQTPFRTPWRTVIVSDDARDILASKLVLNLNEPCAIEDTSWIKPVKYMGVWWEMIVGRSTWAYTYLMSVVRPGLTDYSEAKPNGRHGANNANVKKYIDFAAANGFDQVLVEGWNVGWEDWNSNIKGDVFDYVTPYPDFDLPGLNEYAHDKGVRLMMHHETSTTPRSYERQLDTAFRLMNRYGYNAVKTGYVGRKPMPRGESHYSQWLVNHYLYVVKRAAQRRIMVDAHEAVHPTGLHRTYPNLLAQESARGGENEAFRGNAPDHLTLLPFTRLIGGPMDYTPGIFNMDNSKYVSWRKTRVTSTIARQLALYVTMYSPLQMAADFPETYAKFMDAFQFIKDVAVDWDDSWYLEAEPGQYITVARKAKGRDEWFVGGITNGNPREAVVDMGFLPEGKYEVTIYEDGKDADWRENPQSYNIRSVRVTPKSVLRQPMVGCGGFAMTIRPRK